jgi:hypothetical protein
MNSYKMEKIPLDFLTTSFLMTAVIKFILIINARQRQENEND